MHSQSREFDHHKITDRMCRFPARQISGNDYGLRKIFENMPIRCGIRRKYTIMSCRVGSDSSSKSVFASKDMVIIASKDMVIVASKDMVIVASKDMMIVAS